MSRASAGSKNYVDTIEEQHPGYLHFLFRAAQKVKGSKATYTEIADYMNVKSACPSEVRPTLSLHRLQILRWFHDNNGKEHSPKEKPLDTPELMKLREEWVREHHNLLTDNNAPIAYIDEKWFYTTNRRRKIKKLPLGPNEKEGDDAIIIPKMRSRRFPVKTMFMGVVGRPREDKGFNGKIYLKRVSEEVSLQKRATNQNFSPDRNINSG